MYSKHIDSKSIALTIKSFDKYTLFCLKVVPSVCLVCPLPHLFHNPCFLSCFFINSQRVGIVILIGLEYTNKSICPHNLFIFVLKYFFSSSILKQVVYEHIQNSKCGLSYVSLIEIDVRK